LDLKNSAFRSKCCTTNFGYKWVVLDCYGHSRLSAMSIFDRVRTISNSQLISMVTLFSMCTVTDMQQSISTKLQFISIAQNLNIRMQLLLTLAVAEERVWWSVAFVTVCVSVCFCALKGKRL